MMKAPIAKIGEIQRIDIEDSSAPVFYDDIGRFCKVVKPQSVHNRGDKSPYRMANLFGGNWQDYNNHYIVQAAGCPLDCPYCYVDNFKADYHMSADELVERFVDFKERAEDKLGIYLKVYHFMGGAPALYCDFWPELRESLDRHGLEETILFSDTILLENHFAGVKPWEHMGLHHFILTGDLKGTNPENFKKNTGGFDLFGQSLEELKHYLPHENFYLTLIGFEEKDLPEIYKIVPKDRIDFLSIINYEVTKRKMATGSTSQSPRKRQHNIK